MKVTEPPAHIPLMMSLLQKRFRMRHNNKDFFNSLYLYHWIGLNRSQNAGSWQWTEGSLFSSGLFNIKLKSPGGDCIAYGSRTSGHAENCTTAKNYICEYSRRQPFAGNT
ncbi:NKG2-D type II integral membrane protein-like isoform X1 [Ornithorhynchus anatinus]|uniref:NKG2-D type II integral membrane protein-like isoform X1 n=1 Tax=Ornithorhynchus anatinus TaxID=9258 RepID=UPI0004543C9B|nr:NKG2-D type II integral membrane protein-like isoform X1 [Ornithorhynchus anatinus]